MPLKLNSTGGGSVTLDTPSTASNYTLTVPAITGTAVVTGSSGTVSQGMLASGVAGNGPAFSVIRLTSNQSFTATTYTKVQFNSVAFDTDSDWDSVNYRFVPSVEGYYQFSLSLAVTSASTGAEVISSIYKNGAEAAWVASQAGGNVRTSASVSSLIYMNGTTDYVEGYVFSNGTTPVVGTTVRNQFSGCLVRAA